MTRAHTSFFAVSPLAVAAAVSGMALLWADPSHAGIESCGNINVEAEAQCEVQAEGGCEASCEGDGFELSCNAELHASCKAGECDLELPECELDCRGECEAECDLEPGDFECEGSCQGACEADCEGQCEASANRSECEGSCKATCSGECGGSCEGTPPSASCEAKCEGSCKGQCDGRANFECQAECQATGRADCEGEMRLKCEGRCQEPEGAVFCDGQYVDHGDNFQECVAALNATLDVEVEGSASSSGECGSGRCEGTAEAKGSASCAVSRPGAGDAGASDASNWLSVLALALVAAGARRARRHA